MWNNAKQAAVAAAMVMTLGACGSPGGFGYPASPAPVSPATSASASGIGTIQAIDLVQGQRSGPGLGTVAGAVVGGVLGNQVGGGSGRAAATVAGAVGGGYVGNRMEQNTRTADQAYRIAVRMDNGYVHTLTQSTAPNLQIGERVRVDNGVIVERYR
jgi:outer membrane lipoprotein SlyB